MQRYALTIHLINDPIQAAKDLQVFLPDCEGKGAVLSNMAGVYSLATKTAQSDTELGQWIDVGLEAVYYQTTWTSY